MLKIYNSLTRTVEEFIPIDAGKVRMYSCGPTVYNYQHIGNFRTFLFEDILLRTLRYSGYEVKYVMNITDVGHLTSDEDEGEDKMELSAKEQGKSVWDIAQYYTGIFKKDSQLLNIIPPDVYSKATDYIGQQIAMVKCLEEKGYTYRTGDGIYFDTSKFDDYTKLARLDVEGMKEGARVEYSAEKRNITDFALWKFSPESGKRQMEWESPWGTGFPGWHIECSAMSTSILGNHFDIHCGGIDHLPVHHTNEIAQSEACTGEKYVNYWLHGEFLNMGDEKMSKSTGKFITVSTLTEMGYSPMDYRYFLLMAHYRKKLRFTFDALNAAKSGYRNLLLKVSALSKQSENNLIAESETNAGAYMTKFLAAVNDDLNMPVAMSVLWELLKDNSVDSAKKLSLAKEFDKILGLNLNDDTLLRANEEIVPDEVLKLAEQRFEAKKAKNFTLADELREKVKQMGFEILDSKDGYSVRASS